MKELLNNLLRLQEYEFGTEEGKAVDTAIAKLREKIPPPILAHYDRLANRGKSGVAIVRHQVCTGCYMRVPIGTINRLMHVDDITMCESCGRYLYLPEEEKVFKRDEADCAAHRA